MSRRMNRIQAAFVIGRRDYTATVFSRAFLFFLLGPLFPVLLGILFGGLGARVAESAERTRVAVIAAPAEFKRLDLARGELLLLPGSARLPELVAAPGDATPAQILADGREPVVAVLADPFGTPRLTGSLAPRDPMVGQVQLLLSRARADVAPLPSVAVDRVAVVESAGSVEQAREITGRAGQALLFLLTLLLSGMLLSQLIEEKSNKVIEVLAAAVPVESIFIGKLFAMLAMSLTGIAVWMTAGVTALLVFAPGLFDAVPTPAVGWPFFLVLAGCYFGMSYLLIGAAFLGIGAQAGTAREVQTLSMPVTMGQVGLLLLSNFAISDPHGTAGIAAAAFPLSSPFAMIARAALDAAILPHLAALVWQGLWVAVILKMAAAWFRRSVLSGSAKPRWVKRVRKVSEPTSL